MSNEYKDWLWNRAQEVAIERGLVDVITQVEPDDPAEGTPSYIWGIKNGEKVKYYVNYSDETEWLCYHKEADI